MLPLTPATITASPTHCPSRPWFRRALLGAVFAPLLLAVLPAAEARPPASLDELRALRRQAADRPRRVIFNNDGNEPVYLCRDTTPEELLRHRTAPLAGSLVDAIFYCTWSSGFGLFTHDTRVGEVFATKEGLFAKNLAPAMLAAGTDPLRVVAEFGRKHGIEVFWSFRLNDTHDGSGADYGPIMFRANRLKREHPEWLIGSPQQKPKFGAWSAVDFTRAEIRDLAFRFVEEVCQRYPVDGVEIDFFRHPVFFKRAAQTGTACNDEERALMTGLLRRIREMTETEGLRRGRPILVAIRVPDSVEYCRATGIDLERWLSEGLVDLLVTGGYFQLNAPGYSAALAHRHGVKYYPSLDESRVRDEAARRLRSSTAAYRGRALAAWRAGADGMYLFNAFNPNDPIWRQLGSPERLAAADREYFASVLGAGAAAGGAYPHGPLMQVSRLNPAAPFALKPGESAETSLVTGEDGSVGVATLCLQFKSAPAAAALAVQLNATPLTGGTVRGEWLEFVLPPGALRAGANAVRVSLAAGAAAATWTDLRATVRAAAARGPR